MVNVAEETKEPIRNVPLAILLALGIATLLYFLVALAAVLALPAAELARTEAPFALLYTQATGQAPTAISIISLFAVVNGALIQIIMASRVLYGMSREGWLHVALGRVHPVRRTPLLATALVTLSVLVLALWLPLVTLAKATSFITLVAFSFINLALLRIKRRDPRPAGMRIYPVWVRGPAFYRRPRLCSISWQPWWHSEQGSGHELPYGLTNQLEFAEDGFGCFRPQPVTRFPGSGRWQHPDTNALSTSEL